MARELYNDQTSFFRAVIEELVEGEWKVVKTFGPHVYQNQARDHDRSWFRVDEKYAAGTRRKRVQRQYVDWLTGEIAWEDV